MKEASASIEAGFDYVNDIDDTKLFRKRKEQALKNGKKASKNPLSAASGDIPRKPNLKLVI